VLESVECRVFFPQHARKKAEALLRAFTVRRAHAAVWLGQPREGRPELHLVENLDEMRRRGGAGVPDWAVAVARRDDVLVFRLDLVDRTPASSLELVLAHEVVHHVLSHLGGEPLPRWFEEGLCVYNAGVSFLQVDYSIERLAAAGNLPDFADADAAFRGALYDAAVAYKLGHSAVSHFMQHHGVVELRDLLRRVSEGAAFEDAFLHATGRPLQAFEQEWRRTVTPRLPWLLFVLLQNIEVTVLSIGALAVVIGYIRWRIRRERAMQSLGG